jgi:hypothetical protein
LFFLLELEPVVAKLKPTTLELELELLVRDPTRGVFFPEPFLVSFDNTNLKSSTKGPTLVHVLSPRIKKEDLLSLIVNSGWTKPLPTGTKTPHSTGEAFLVETWRRRRMGRGPGEGGGALAGRQGKAVEVLIHVGAFRVGSRISTTYPAWGEGWGWSSRCSRLLPTLEAVPLQGDEATEERSGPMAVGW